MCLLQRPPTLEIRTFILSLLGVGLSLPSSPVVVTAGRCFAFGRPRCKDFSSEWEFASDKGCDWGGGWAGLAIHVINPLDPVIETADGHRLPAVPLQEAHRINLLKERAEGRLYRPDGTRPRGLSRFDQDADADDADGDDSDGAAHKQQVVQGGDERDTGSLGMAMPPLHTHPLFPPLPLYGPPSVLRSLQCAIFRSTSVVLSTAFLAVIVLGAIFTALPRVWRRAWLRVTFRDPDRRRPLYEEEKKRAVMRHEQERICCQRTAAPAGSSGTGADETSRAAFEPRAGGRDRLVCDIGYYARRVGLDVEEFQVQTEDGFLLQLWHIYAPQEYRPATRPAQRPGGPDVFPPATVTPSGEAQARWGGGGRRRKYPVLLIPGLLQSAGAYCTHDDDSLAFFLCKSGYDVWLGNNRCGLAPAHSLLAATDPRMWAWNIRQMGVLDLPALVSRVLDETGFGRLGLVGHSQGTTAAFVALAKEQRPELGDRLSVFCALAPAVYAGPLIGKMYFKFMRAISPAMFRLVFGIHSFIPLMMTMHRLLPGRVYGTLGYLVFSFLFDWSDARWDQSLRSRHFQFAPVHVSAESMRWWLGRECFARQKCVLATREEGQMEDVEDEAAEERREESMATDGDRGRTAWFDEHVPPVALWVAGSDRLVDGARLLRRFERGREPHVRVVFRQVIEEYEHLDVLWAMDAVERVGHDVRRVLWTTMPAEAKVVCRSIEGMPRLGPSGDVESDQGDSDEGDDGGGAFMSATH